MTDDIEKLRGSIRRARTFAVDNLGNIKCQEYVDIRMVCDFLEDCLYKQSALDALERMARAGHGPVFTQRSVGIGQRAAMGTGETSGDFAAAIVALEKTA